MERENQTLRFRRYGIGTPLVGGIFRLSLKLSVAHRLSGRANRVTESEMSRSSRCSAAQIIRRIRIFRDRPLRMGCAKYGLLVEGMDMVRSGMEHVGVFLRIYSLPRIRLKSGRLIGGRKRFLWEALVAQHLRRPLPPCSC
jgi:hypothetical protein